MLAKRTLVALPVVLLAVIHVGSASAEPRFAIAARRMSARAAAALLTAADKMAGEPAGWRMTYRANQIVAAHHTLRVVVGRYDRIAAEQTKQGVPSYVVVAGGAKWHAQRDAWLAYDVLATTMAGASRRVLKMAKTRLGADPARALPLQRTEAAERARARMPSGAGPARPEPVLLQAARRR
jgi:hypothetical protein